MTEKEYKTLPIKSMFIKCTVPNILSMMFSSLYVIVDGIFIGKYVGNVGLAAVNLSWPFLMITFALADMIAVGSSVKLSISLGSGDEKQASKIFSTSVLLVFVLSALFGSLAIIISQYMHVFMPSDLVLAEYTAEYLKYMGYFSVGFIPLFAMDNYLRACGKVKLSMYINIAASLLNIALDWILLAKLGMGIEAAAMSTGISTSIGTLCAVAVFASNKLTLKFKKPNLPLKDIWEIVYNGSSEFFSKITGSLMAILANTFLLIFGGAIAVSAYSIVMYVDGILKSIIYGIVDSLQPPISYNLGAKQPKRVISLYKMSLIVTGSLSFMLMIAFLALPEMWVSIFIDPNDQEIKKITVSALLLFAPSYLTSWYNIITSSIFTSLNRPKESLIVMTLNSVIFPAISIFILSYFMGLYGLFATPAVSQIATFFVCLYYWKKVKKAVLT